MKNSKTTPDSMMSPEPPRPSPKNEPKRSSGSRMLTPSELEALKKDFLQFMSQAKGRFRHLA